MLGKSASEACHRNGTFASPVCNNGARYQRTRSPIPHTNPPATALSVLAEIAASTSRPEAVIGGHQATFWRKFDNDLPNADRVNQVLEWLKLPEGKRPSFFKDVQFLLIGPLWLLAFVYRAFDWRYTPVHDK